MLTDKKRQKIIAKLVSEPSDSKLADKFGISRTTVWRIRQEEAVKQAKLKRTRSRMNLKAKKMQTVKPVSVPLAAPIPVVSVAGVQPAPVSIVPKVDVEPQAMVSYFAVQLLRCEHVKDVAKVVMETAETCGRLFRKLQVLDFVSVGTSSFVRFRSDLADPQAVLAGLNRGFIAFSDGCYRVTTADGKQGVRYPATIMLSVQKVGFGQTFAGPKIKRWKAGFQVPAAEVMGS